MTLMFRYKLRTLLIALALGPPVLAATFYWWVSRDSSSVEGVVTYRGTPAAAVVVKFVPMSGIGSSYVANTDAAGRFRVTRDRLGRAIRPGDYRVTFTAASMPAKYQSATASPIAATISGPEMQFRFDLQ